MLTEATEFFLFLSEREMKLLSLQRSGLHIAMQDDNMACRLVGWCFVALVFIKQVIIWRSRSGGPGDA